MHAIQVLRSEHRTILAVIDALEAFTGEVCRGADDRPGLARFVRFIREFADGHHHAKEEGVLFEAMIEAGFQREVGPVGMMLHEHVMGRGHAAVLAALADQGAPWTSEDRLQLAAAARGYGDLLRAHIQKEDAILYPMAERALPAGLAQRVDDGCAAADAAASASGQLAGWSELAAALVGRGAAEAPDLRA